jgi:2-polyprenyl-3-methyl-5-hydroxy-6-metoxy-1,4-benzoquinol methylase
VGGIDRPLLEKSTTYRYIGLDIEHRDSCEEVYDQFIVQSVEHPLPGQFDLIISRTLLEHVPDNRKSFQSMANALKPGGSMVHYIPCGFHPYSLATRLVGHRLQNILIRKLRPGAASVTGYKAFYHKCTPGG